ncbi:putative paraquat-inducible protein B [Actinobacillus pleuropneumoniae]|uniref:PqiB family protein n=1 Tax=Actinobacillus pleuropneumoniae TaxID=715 RepID=UPI000584C97C|nr:MlaD family protein [Actinobacillus pleuropneumoniae]KIE90256.1 putative paraquat-inducible protein B [Actinobacillus pleuropneumoniae]KIE90438.1 putative paraquat-inducible protein B [Actinobacillus pleuropneumoniae]KIE90519.1 putative paraquat-inducible protein B [Actinobacillus pleuropneumoniae]KIE96150.1 putative paraquat-inducible protein B [Actinobacillus pleuropneumoniae]KIE96911.1 putative paraquat-inducible protein B [Actinobacillus pleuropneumoniae]
MTDNISQPVEAKVRQPRKISPFWLLPIVAFVIGGLLFFQILKEQGEMITIRFNEGDGITAGKTVIRYQGLQIGQVKKVYFVEDLKKVEVQAEVNPEAKSVLREQTKFWLVKPSASIAGVSGLDALVSGNYITLLPGEGKSSNEFIAEEEPPTVAVTDGDLLIRLISDDLGSITVGASVYFRKVPVGSIADYRFTADQKKVEIDVVIDKKYANLVKQDSHFWNISGINANIGLSGVSVNVDSIASVVQGAVAFDSPDESKIAEQGQKFTLYESLKSAQRGKEIHVVMPIMPNLKVNETPVFYQNIQVGVLSGLALSAPSDEKDAKTESQPLAKGMARGTLLIDPNHVDLFKSGTQILLKEPKFALNKEQISKVGELLRGIYFDISAGKGEPKLEFEVQKEADYLLSRPNLLALTFSAPQSYSVDQGQGIYYNDVQIGELLKRKLTLDGVTFQGIIYPPYRHLVAANSKFVAISNLDVSVGLDGMRVQAGSPSDWLKGGIRLLTNKAQGEAKKQYPLYKDVESAEAGIIDDEKKTTLTLSANDLSGIDKGSVVLYRNFQIGEVLKVRPQKNKFDVDLFVEPAYRHLLSDKSRFWIEPAVSAELSMKGLNVQAAPLMRTLKGAISFDNGGTKGDKTLYASQAKATSGNTRITLIAKDASKLSKGMDIKYMGLTIGQIESLELQNAKKQIKATAYIDSQYYALVAKEGSRFSAISPEITTSGVKNIDAALQNYINVDAGSGNRKTQFSLSDTDTNKTIYANGFSVIVETSDARGIEVDAPVLYRGMQVGIVKRLNLSELGDRVMIHLSIESKYQHLVRNNTEFWAASGYTMDISLQGVSMNSGTMSQLLKGGIEFSTPSGRVVQPQAKPNRHFLLQRKIPQEAPEWDQGIAE